MDKITGAQAAVLTVIGRISGGASKAQLVEAGCDIRAANNLVLMGLLARSPLNVYTLTTGGFSKRLYPWQCMADEPTEAEEVVERKTKPVRKVVAKRDPVACLCGCKIIVKGIFAQGHDAKLHSAILKAKKENAQVVVSELAATWLTGKAWATGGFTTVQS